MQAKSRLLSKVSEFEQVDLFFIDWAYFSVGSVFDKIRHMRLTVNGKLRYSFSRRDRCIHDFCVAKIGNSAVGDSWFLKLFVDFGKWLSILISLLISYITCEYLKLMSTCTSCTWDSNALDDSETTT